MNRKFDIFLSRRSKSDLFLTHSRLIIPARWDRIIFWIVSLFILIIAGTTNRTGMLDNENYLNYFRETDLDWFISFFSSQKNSLALFFAFFTEEPLWRAWALILGFFFLEDQAVLITVLLLNSLIILALSKTSRPLFGILLWILLPPALAVIGTFQIRQGFAFSIMLYTILSLRRPFIGYIIAATLHTTFTVILVYALCLKIVKTPGIRLFFVFLLVSLMLTIAGNQLFHDYGGRRAEQYSIQVGSDSINYVFGALILAIPSFLYLMQSKKNLSPITELASIHIGCIFFIVMSWFFFPIGTSRNGYFALLFLIVIIPEFRKENYVSWYIWSSILIYFAYIIINNYVDGGYDELFKSL